MSQDEPVLSEGLLTVRQVADLLSVSTATVYKLCDRDELEHLRVSNAIRVRPPAIAAFLERQRRRNGGSADGEPNTKSNAGEE